MPLIGALVLLTAVAIVLIAGCYIMKIPYDNLLGVASGATGNPAFLVYSTLMAPTERPDIDLSVDDDCKSHRGADRRPRYRFWLI